MQTFPAPEPSGGDKLVPLPLPQIWTRNGLKKGGLKICPYCLNGDKTGEGKGEALAGTQLGRLAILEGVTTKALDELAASATTRRWPAGQFLFQRGMRITAFWRSKPGRSACFW